MKLREKFSISRIIYDPCLPKLLIVDSVDSFALIEARKELLVLVVKKYL